MMGYSTEAETISLPEPAAHPETNGRIESPRGVASVSVVIPCYNEERFIGKVLGSLAPQYETERYEIIVVDGMSTDDTRGAIAEFTARNEGVNVRVVDNPARNIPTALNRGIGQARGEIIVRMDAHSVPSANYVRRCVEQLEHSGAAVVGMPWLIRPGADSPAAKAIALAAAHPFGIGDAKYRLGEGAAAQIVDTVPYGAFRKSLWSELGGFNENLLINEDYDFNYRVRLRGGSVLLDSSAYSEYYARPRLRDLARQYVRYGHWKAQMLKLHPRSLRGRHLVAPAFVAALALTAAAGLMWTPARWLFLSVIVAYALPAVYFSAKLSRRAGDWRLLPFVATAFFIIHCAWGGGLLVGLLRPPRRTL